MSGSKAGGPGNDQIEIMMPEGQKRIMTVPGNEFTIGRGPENTISINDQRASREHVKVSFQNGAYWVNDRDSQNGTFWDGQKLLPGRPEQWRPERSLRIGRHLFRLLLQPAIAQNSGVVSPTAVEADLPNDQSYASEARRAPSQSQDLRLELQQLAYETMPGQPVMVTVSLTNQSDLTAHYDLSVSGLPSDWVTIYPDRRVELMDRASSTAQKNIHITIKPPDTAKIRAGRFAFRVHVTKSDAPDQRVSVEARLVIKPIGNVEAELRQTKARVGASLKVAVNNRSNAPQAVSLRCWDEANELKFDIKEKSLTVAAGDSQSLEFSARLRKQRWIGGERQHRFKVKVKGAIVGADQVGEFTSRGLIPNWVPPVVLLLIVGLISLSINAYQSQQRTFATQTAVSTAATAVAVVNATSAAATEVAIEQVTATAIANAAATEQWLQGDDDRDGLTNGFELDNKLDPYVKDSDGDGRDDGEELNSDVKTDPTNKDSDGDQLTDGEELRRGLDPNKADSDGDGLPDNVDPDPHLWPTHTPTPTDTPDLAATREFFAQQTRDAQAATSTAEVRAAIGTQTAEAKETEVKLDQERRDAVSTQAAAEATSRQQMRDTAATTEARQIAEAARVAAEATAAEMARQQAASEARQAAQAATLEALQWTPTPRPLVDMKIGEFCQRRGWTSVRQGEDLYSWGCRDNSGNVMMLTDRHYQQLCIEQVGEGSVPVTVSQTSSGWRCRK